MMDKVYIIEQGCYSDYRVVGIFSTREAAQKACDWINANDRDKAEVNERQLNPGLDDINAGHVQWSVTMLRDGSVEICRKLESFYELGPDYYIWDRPKDPAYIRNPSPPPAALRARVLARDEAHAIKIANEKRIQMIASGEWA